MGENRAVSFSRDIQRITEQYRKRLNYVAKKATNDVIDAARLSRFDGGRMPIDTSNLQKSMVASTTGIPSGPSDGNESRTGDDVIATLVRWQPGVTPFWAGFTANYSRAMEAQYGFVRGATERWEEFVDRAAAEAKAKNL